MPEKDTGSGEYRTLKQYSARIQILVWIGSLIAVCIGGALYVSARPTRAEVKAEVERSVRQVQHATVNRTEFAVLKTRVDADMQRNKEWRADIKQTLKDIKRSLKDLSDRLPYKKGAPSTARP